MKSQLSVLCMAVCFFVMAFLVSGAAGQDDSDAWASMLCSAGYKQFCIKQENSSKEAVPIEEELTTKERPYDGSQATLATNETPSEPQQKSTNPPLDHLCETQDPSTICTLPQSMGPCRAYFIRYFFNSQSGSCEKMAYGGCLGNANNFASEEECQSCCGFYKK
eukprot:TRINITY_DN1618_c0_g1_i2.p5 TRINITY_DN1618_c0_g1~~TRINITY_DN1618_c0_g1_i2.p5  ORF type:complete len:164 (-),score=25.96 TRINITY_DN1618_c0_g1_i2:625-1116(-)